jgi:hypothetical protein
MAPVGTFAGSVPIRALDCARSERCRLGFCLSLRKHMRFLSMRLVGAWRNGGARALGARGCGFESHRPDQFLPDGGDAVDAVPA